MLPFRPMKLLLPILALFVGSTVLSAEPEDKKPADPVQHVDAKAAAKLLTTDDKDKKPVILDVRTPAEFAKGHLKDATNVSFTGDDFEGAIAKLDKDQPYLVHCRSGGRSTSSLEAFKKLGFKKIYHLDGGYLAWQEAGQEVVK